MKLGVSGPDAFVCVPVPPNTHSEGEILSLIGQRMMVGFDRYGGSFDRESEKDWLEEQLEEILDATVYVAKRILQIREHNAAVLAHAKSAAEEQAPDTAKDGRQVHCVRPGKVDCEGNCPGEKNSGGGTGGCQYSFGVYGGGGG